jgi:hypothetical protein
MAKRDQDRTIRFGSKSCPDAAKTRFLLLPNSGHRATTAACPKSANKRLRHCSNSTVYSITSSARASIRVQPRDPPPNAQSAARPCGAEKSAEADIKAPPAGTQALSSWRPLAIADPEFKTRLAHLDGTPLGGSPTNFGKLIADETEKWGKVIRLANIKPE